MAVDIRSDDMGLLLDTERQILVAIDQAVAEENRRWSTSSLAVTRKMVGDRPGGRTSSDSTVVQAAIRANAAFGRKTMLVGGSADANVPMALGIPAITISGGGKSGGFHTLGEWFDPTDAWQGSQSSLMTVLGLVGVQGVSEPQLAKRPPRAR